jgi:acyl-CoA reductase-like NAD-dependent aldehyde dehydrogenase
MAAFMICTHAGQGCALTTRLLVPRNRYNEAVETTASAMSGIRCGDPTDRRTMCGPLISARQRVHGTNTDRARSVAARIRTGTLSVNGAMSYSADVPFGGYKQSWTGREMGVAGFEEYLETKVIAGPA